MLNFQKSTVALIILALTLFQAWFSLGISIWYLWAVIIIYLLLLVYGSIFLCASFYVKAHCRNKGLEEKEIAISFDDGPNPVITPLILDILGKHSAKAGFFVIGKKIAGNEELLKSIDEKGHMIGNHSFSHSNFYDFYGSKRLMADLKKTEVEIEAITGKKAAVFRPPYGVTNPHIRNAVRKLNYKVMGWSIRSFDTSIKDEVRVFDKIVRKIEPGAVILLHDNHERTADILEMLLEYLTNQNYKIVRPDHLLNMEAYRNEN